MLRVFSTRNFNKCPDSGCVQKKPNGKWGVISGKTGKFWDADYDTEEDARAGLRAYFANKHFSIGTLDLYGERTGKYEPMMVIFLQDGKQFTWYQTQFPKEYRDSPLSEIVRSSYFRKLLLERRDQIILPINRYHPQFRQTVSEFNKFLDNNFLIR